MTNILANRSASDRPATDFYATPYDVTRALLLYLSLPKTTTIWEPAAGDGRMVKEIEANGYRCRSTDLSAGEDFLQATSNLDEWIITNPPFIHARAFIEKAAQLAPQGFAYLLKSQFWHAATRRELFYRYRPSYVLPLSWRPDFLFGSKSSSPTMEVLWTVWQPPFDKETILDVLARPR